MAHTSTRKNNSTARKLHGNKQSNQGDEATGQVRACARKIIEQVKSLRNLHNFDDDMDIAVYITDTPLVHSALEVYRDEIEDVTNAVDFVQINIDAGIPMPEHLAYKRITMGDQIIDVAIDEAEDNAG